MWPFRKQAPRMGTPIVGTREFQSNVLFAGPTGIGILTVIRAAHQRTSAERKSELTVDDSDPAAPVYFFDARFPGVKVNDYDLWLQLFAAEGDSDGLARCAQRCHQFIYVVRAGPWDRVAWKTWLRSVPSDRRNDIHLLVIANENAQLATQEVAGEGFVSINTFNDDDGVISSIRAAAKNVLAKARN
jgi:hypothetical protein